jgi:hypothetical protein
MTRRLDVGPSSERVCATNAGDRDTFLKSPRMRRFTEIWVTERKRQLGLRETQK